MPQPIDVDQLTTIVRKIFIIEDFIQGDDKKTFILRFRGKLIEPDSSSAYDLLSAEMEPFGLTPRFFLYKGKQVISLERSLPEPKPLNPHINLVLFILTLLSVIFTGAMYGMQGDFPSDPLQAVKLVFSQGWPFAVALLAILATHEFGHYFAGRRHGVQVTLPYFIPLPLSAFGTLGAFINMRSLPKNKRILFDIAITGPLSGLIVSVVVLLIGLNLSSLNSLPPLPDMGVGLQMEGNSLLYLALKYLVFGKVLPQPANISGISLIFFWGQYFFTGHPFPWGSLDVLLHPVAWAGWAGLFVTTINLLPVGQLDGGHIFSSLFGEENAQRIYPFILTGLVLLGFFWNTWWIWALLLFLLGRFYAQPLDQITKLDPRRRTLGWLALVVFIITFIPVPLSIIS